jgi:hypothetical protein
MVVGGVDIQMVVTVCVDDPDVKQAMSLLQRYGVLDEPVRGFSVLQDNDGNTHNNEHRYNDDPVLTTHNVPLRLTLYVDKAL